MNHRPDESVRENTVHSLREAYTSGAAYVEFDVQVRQLAVSTSNRTRLESNNALSVTALPLTALPVTALTITALPITARAHILCKNHLSRIEIIDRFKAPLKTRNGLIRCLLSDRSSLALVERADPNSEDKSCSIVLFAW